MQEQKQRVGSGELGNVDYYALMGLRRGCSRFELERAHLLLTLNLLKETKPEERETKVKMMPPEKKYRIAILSSSKAHHTWG
ncbi:hypothetical protein L1887_12398 [Cichorium endivia]|nr:hypothetical protein L1887_12398 [Cichorium endivia]